jgi:hypothetical protein
MFVRFSKWRLLWIFKSIFWEKEARTGCCVRNMFCRIPIKTLRVLDPKEQIMGTGNNSEKPSTMKEIRSDVASFKTESDLDNRAMRTGG